MSPPAGYICGCYYLLVPVNQWSTPVKKYIAQVNTKAHSTILATTSRTTLTQTFVNPSEHKAIKELNYSFPIYDGVSVVGFTCRIGDRTIVGEVKEKDKARAVYKEAKERGQVVGLLEQLPEASDVFITKLGNVPPGATVVVDITYLGELSHDAEVDGIRFTIPTFIAPRYGSYPSEVSDTQRTLAIPKGFEVTVDAELGEGAYIREMRSPSHPIAVSLGTTSLGKDADPTPNKASATLSLGSAELDKDFVLQVVAKETAVPKAMLETHPTIPGQRALMATLVPKFALPPERPEIVFVCDRSGSMSGNKIVALRNALKVFLKSLPVGTKFNICSFGSHHTFLWKKSNSYSQTSLDEAMKHLETFSANYGGTEMYGPLEETIKRRYADMNLEIFLVTDGEIWDQQRLFDLLNTEIGTKKAPIRVFTLGVGDAFSSSLIEGVARAGNGFSQAVGENEKLDGKVVRMLKAALSPHVNDYTLEVKYADGTIDKAVDSLEVALNAPGSNSGLSSVKEKIKSKISLFDTSSNPDASEPQPKDEDGQEKYRHLPTIDPPKLLQAPHKIPPLFPFSRTTVYLLVSPLADQSTPTAVILRGTSNQGPLELEIPVQVLSEPGETIHQLAAKRAVHELEEGRGWLYDAKDAASSKLLKEKHEGRFTEFVEREAVRLGVQFQVGGKFCSFVAVEKEEKEGDKKMSDGDDWEFLDEQVEKMNLGEGGSFGGAEDSGMRYVQSSSFNATKKKRLGNSNVDARSYRMASGSLRSRGGPALSKASYAPNMPAPSGISSFAMQAAPAPPSSKPSASIGGFNGLSEGATATYGYSPAAPPPPPAPRNIFSSALASVRSSPIMARKSAPAPASAPRPVYEQYSLDQESEDEEDDGVLQGSIADSAADKTKSIESIVTRGYELPKKAKKGKKTSIVAPVGTSKPLALQPQADPLQTLIELQTFEGYWALDEKLCSAVGAKLDAVAREAKSKGLDANVLATALAVHFLTTKLKEEEESWELVVDKANGWLEMNGCAEGSESWKIVAGLI